MNTKKQQRRAELEARLASAQGGQPEVKNLLGLEIERFTPLADQVLLDVQVEKQRGSIIIPTSAQQSAALGMPVGRVAAVGDKVERVKVGDLVLVNPRDPTVSRIDVLMWLAPEAKILCKVAPKVESVIQSLQ